MPFPVDLQTVTVTVGPYYMPDGSTAGGVVYVAPEWPLVHAPTGLTVLAEPVAVRVDHETGVGSVVLPATDAAGLVRSNFRYTVSERIGGRPAAAFLVQFPAASPSVRLADAVPVSGPAGSSQSVFAVTSLNGLRGAASISGGANVTVSTDAATNGIVVASSASTAHVHAVSAVTDFREAVEDTLAAMFRTVGTDLTINYDDAAGTITLGYTPGSPEQTEAMQDAIGAALVGVGNMTVVYDEGDPAVPGSGTVTISTAATVNATDAALRDRATHTGTQLAATISDATATGRAVLTAADAAAARTATGAASAAHTHGVTDLTATGTRDATTVLHGDNTWKAPAGGGGGFQPTVTDYTVAGSYTYTVPAGATTLELSGIGGGAGGGGGSRNSSTTAHTGGSGGGGGGWSFRTVSLADLGNPATLTVVVAAGGAGGAGATADNSSGVTGTSGGQTYIHTPSGTIGNVLRSRQGVGGNGGSTAASVSGGGGGSAIGQGGQGGASSGTAGGSDSSSLALGAAGGGGGGAFSSAGAALGAGNGGAQAADARAVMQTNDANGHGASPAASFGPTYPGLGGRGGTSDPARAGGNGGNGGWPGGAGGGGAASLNGFNGGNGGAGADGAVRIVAS